MVIDYSRIKRDSAYHIFSPYRTIAEGKGYSVNRGHADGIRKNVILLNSKNKYCAFNIRIGCDQSLDILGWGEGYNFHCNVGDDILYATLDANSLIPIFITQPKYLSSAIDLVSVDPRFLAYIDPIVVKNEDEVKQLLAVSRKASKEILSYQLDFGVNSSDPNEINMRKKFLTQSHNAAKEFINKYNEMKDYLEMV